MSANKSQDYLVRRIKDETHAVTGTAFNPGQAKKGDEDLENWLLRLLNLRERFDIEKKNQAIASRIIRDELGDGRVKPYDPEQGKKYAKYLPFWARHLMKILFDGYLMESRRRRVVSTSSLILNVDFQQFTINKPTSAYLMAI